MFYWIKLTLGWVRRWVEPPGMPFVYVSLDRGPLGTKSWSKLVTWVLIIITIKDRLSLVNHLVH